MRTGSPLTLQCGAWYYWTNGEAAVSSNSEPSLQLVRFEVYLKWSMPCSTALDPDYLTTPPPNAFGPADHFQHRQALHRQDGMQSCLLHDRDQLSYNDVLCAVAFAFYGQIRVASHNDGISNNLRAPATCCRISRERNF